MSSSGDFEEDALDPNLRLLYVSLSALFFGAQFIASWTLMHRVAKFLTFSVALKADICSRISSTIHSIFIVPALAAGISAMPWGEGFEPLGPVAWLQGCLCFTTGYFLADLVVILTYRVPQWGVYVAHHVMASTPYIIYLFVAPCSYGLFVLSMFLLVETTNLSLNAQAFLEQFNYANTRLYVVALYCTAIGWIPFRIVNPIALIVIIHTRMFPAIPRRDWWCLIPSTVCAYFIVLFCLLGFFMVTGKEVYLRWRSKPAPGDIAQFGPSTQPMRLNPKVPMSEEELELTIPSPTRVLLYEARGKMKEVSDSFNEAVSAISVNQRGPTEGSAGGVVQRVENDCTRSRKG